MKASFEPHKFNKEQFKAIGEHIIVCDMAFDVRITNGGIILPNDDMKSAGIRPRWAKIYALGPDQNDPQLEVGKWICISHGRWTRGVDIEDEEGKKTIRRVDPNDILLISDEPVNDLTMSDKV
jgi:NOL1/NOP2/fmu family ribosome biogenesis protein